MTLIKNVSEYSCDHCGHIMKEVYCVISNRPFQYEYHLCEHCGEEFFDKIEKDIDEDDDPYDTDYKACLDLGKIGVRK